MAEGAEVKEEVKIVVAAVAVAVAVAAAAAVVDVAAAVVVAVVDDVDDLVVDSVKVVNLVVVVALGKLESQLLSSYQLPIEPCSCWGFQKIP